MTSGLGLAQIVSIAALMVVAAGLLIAITLAAVTRSYTPALPVLLDFLMAAGLLRLAGDSDWRTISSAAAMVIIRKTVTAGIRTADRSRLLPRDSALQEPPSS
jgi:hypothetical protein